MDDELVCDGSTLPIGVVSMKVLLHNLVEAHKTSCSEGKVSSHSVAER